MSAVPEPKPAVPPETASDPAPAATQKPSAGRVALRFGEAVIAGLIAGFVLFALAPVVLGWRPYTVLTGSMRPVIQPGDVVMDQPVKIADAHVGDVVTFSDPSRDGVLVTHRIRSITRGPVQTDVETRGDANNTSERWTIKTQDRVGRVVYVIPKVGHVANAIRNPAGIILLVVIPVLGIGFGVVRKIWQEDDEDGDAPQDGGGEPERGAPEPATDQAEAPVGDAEPAAAGPEPAPGAAKSQDEGADAAPDR